MVLHIKWFRITIKKYCITYFILLIVVVFVLFTNIFSESNQSINPVSAVSAAKKVPLTVKILAVKRFYNDAEFRKKIYKMKIERLTQKIKSSRVLTFNDRLKYHTNHNVHIFYYAWYGNVEYDGDYYHWNHHYIPDWKKRNRIDYPQDSHNAPADIGSNYYPSSGCYSSRDPTLIQTHIKQLKSSGVGVLIISWTPPGMKDSPHDILPTFFEIAHENDIKISLHIEPYNYRSPTNLREHLKSFFNTYLHHPALYKIKTSKSSVELPVLYIYDSYLISAESWKELLTNSGKISVRGTNYDAVFLGLLVDIQHRYHVKKSGFDGFYTYFATNGFTYGSSWKNWNNLQKFAEQFHLMFVPSIGPGYIDVRIRPWNSVNTRFRRHGQYYDVAWRSAITSNVKYISITSFNEWHEGTQIEPAKPMSTGNMTYLDYEPEGVDFYLNLTKWWVGQFSKKRI